MSRFFVLFLVLFVSLTSLVASASDVWLHSRLTGTNGDGILLDYQLFPVTAGSSSFVYALPLWINILGNNLTGSNHVRAVVGNSCSSSRDSQIVDLQYAGGNRYTAYLRGSVISSSTPQGTNNQCFETVAVVVDGTWITGPNGMMINLANGRP